MIELAATDFTRQLPPKEPEFPEACRTGGRYVHALFRVQFRSVSAGSARQVEKFVTGVWWAPINAFSHGKPGDWPIPILDDMHTLIPHTILGWIRLPDSEFDPQTDDEVRFLKGGAR